MSRQRINRLLSEVLGVTPILDKSHCRYSVDEQHAITCRRWILLNIKVKRQWLFLFVFSLFSILLVSFLIVGGIIG